MGDRNLEVRISNLSEGMETAYGTCNELTIPTFFLTESLEGYGPP